MICVSFVFVSEWGCGQANACPPNIFLKQTQNRDYKCESVGYNYAGDPVVHVHVFLIVIKKQHWRAIFVEKGFSRNRTFI